MALKPVIISGGGLAGLALGIGLRTRGVPVTVLEAAKYPRHRVCGEFISGIQPEALEALGIDNLFKPALRPQQTEWFDGNRSFYRATLPEPAYGVSRHYLDHALATRFRALGGLLKTGERSETRRPGEGTVLATGRVATAHRTRLGRKGWFGIKAHYAGLECTADLEVHLGNNAYVGLTAVEEGWVNVTGLFRAGMGTAPGDTLVARAAADAGLENLAARLNRARLRPGSLKGVNRFELGWQPGYGHGIRIGDAAAMIAPVTGNGMTMALQGAWAAVEPLHCWSRGDSEWRATENRVLRIQRHLFSGRLQRAKFLQHILMTRWSRRVCGFVLEKNWVSFDTLYRMVR